jgi:hypothetical protein
MTVARWLPRAGATVQELRALVEALPPGPELVAAWSVSAAYASMGFRNAEARQWAERARARAEQIGDQAARADAQLWVAVALLQSGDDRGWALAEESVAEVRAAPANFFHSWVVWWPYHVAVMGKRYALADRWFSKGRPYASEHDLETIRQFFLAWRARQLLEQGRWDEAEAMATSVVQSSPVEDGRMAIAIETLARIHTRRGDAAAGDVLGEAQRIVEPARLVVEGMVRD